MKLTSITVEKYRSITRAHRVPISDMTVLVGPNNEGKSNILRALVAAMNVLTRGTTRQTHGTLPAQKGRIPGGSRIYDWDTDFPIHLQEKQPTGQSVIHLDFRLDDEELQEFRAEVGSRLRDNLPLRIALGPREFSVSVHKKGPGGPALSKKQVRIAEFVARRLEFEHIPAVRTAESAQQIVSALVSRELARLEGNDEYAQALRKIEALQQPTLDQLSASIKHTLIKFLPKVNSVTVQIARARGYAPMRQWCEVSVDDGTPTLLEYKGDGVQSLAALALMRHAAETSASGRQLVIAIEEPESHLHSSAVHEIRDVLKDLSAKHQVVVTTHNPLFVDRIHPASNILVSQRRARPAKSVKEIREILGVRASDNLRHAELVVVVEGDEDCQSLGALLGHVSQSLREAIHDQVLALDSLNGASNLAYKLGSLRAAVCATHCVLDDDRSGREAYKRADQEGLVTLAECNFITCPGRSEAELEDLFNPAVYVDLLKNRYRVALSPEARSSKKWSERMGEVFKRQGKPWDDSTKRDVKAAIAAKVAEVPDAALLDSCRASFDALVSALEARLREIRGGSAA
ncbi:MAG: AAA family ATPase [Bryobacterales bacterium]|nr:AAA family ATPase [Bryobacterales bacterium]